MITKSLDNILSNSSLIKSLVSSLILLLSCFLHSNHSGFPTMAQTYQYELSIKPWYDCSQNIKYSSSTLLTVSLFFKYLFKCQIQKAYILTFSFETATRIYLHLALPILITLINISIFSTLLNIN